jgi:energy-converting hydrogenase Eha subunit C
MWETIKLYFAMFIMAILLGYVGVFMLPIIILLIMGYLILRIKDVRRRKQNNKHE